MAGQDAIIAAQPPSETRDPAPSAPSVPRWAGWISGLGPPGFAAVYSYGRRRGSEDESGSQHPGVPRFWKKILGLWTLLFAFVLLFGFAYGAATDYFDHRDVANAFPANAEASRLADDAALQAAVLALGALALLPITIVAVARIGSLTFGHSFQMGQRAVARPEGASVFDWWTAMRKRLTRRSAAAIVLWRIQVFFDGWIALALVGWLGRWPAAWIMGLLFAIFSAIFLYLLDGERAMNEMREWLRDRRFVRRFILPIAERKDRTGTLLRIIAIPYTVMMMGPFPTAVTYHAVRVPRVPAYTLAVLGSFPFQLLWTGIVLGSLWDIAIQPAFIWLWDEVLEPFLSWIWVESLQPALSAPYGAAAAILGVLA